MSILPFSVLNPFYHYLDQTKGVSFFRIISRIYRHNIPTLCYKAEETFFLGSIRPLSHNTYLTYFDDLKYDYLGMQIEPNYLGRDPKFCE